MSPWRLHPKSSVQSSSLLTGHHTDVPRGHKPCVQPRRGVGSCIWVLWSLGYSQPRTGHRRPRTKEKTSQKDHELAGTKRGLSGNIPPHSASPNLQLWVWFLLGAASGSCEVPVKHRPQQSLRRGPMAVTPTGSRVLRSLTALYVACEPVSWPLTILADPPLLDSPQVSHLKYSGKPAYSFPSRQ